LGASIQHHVDRHEVLEVSGTARLRAPINQFSFEGGENAMTMNPTPPEDGERWPQLEEMVVKPESFGPG
jgi:hypothetical protein